MQPVYTDMICDRETLPCWADVTVVRAWRHSVGPLSACVAMQMRERAVLGSVDAPLARRLPGWMTQMLNH